VRNYKRDRRQLKDAGHDFSTDVDTEVIPHTVTEVPDDVDELTYSSYSISGNLNYLLFAEQGVFVRAQRKYELTDDLRMTCRINEVEDMGFAEGDNRWLVARPGGDIETAESNVTTYNASSTTVSSQSSYRNNSRRRGNRSSGAATWPSANGTRTSDTDDYVTIQYEDHASRLDTVSAVKVAPGVMRVHDENKDEVAFIKRNLEPKLYYFYAPDETPDDQVLDELEAHANSDSEADGEQQTFQEVLNQEAVDATDSVVQDVANVGDAVARIVDGE
jgi:hypothetical protein